MLIIWFKKYEYALKVCLQKSNIYLPATKTRALFNQDWYAAIFVCLPAIRLHVKFIGN
jgi:hypothetical protein